MSKDRATRYKTETDFIDSMHPVNMAKVLDALKTLTPREREVLKWVVSGRLNKEIASELGITIRTVKEHRARVMQKMEVNSLAELVRMIVSVRFNEARMTPQANR